MNISCYNSIPGLPIAYWISKELRHTFFVGKPLSEFAAPKKGLSTGNNDVFLRLWYEVSNMNTCCNATDTIYAMYTGKKWFPICKGGLFRKWYGNNDYLVNFQYNGKELQNNEQAIIRNPNYYFGESLTWTDLTTGKISVRFNEKGFIHDVAGPCIFNLGTNNYYLLGLLNSKVADSVLSITSPTLHFNVGNICDFPMILKKSVRLDDLVQKNIEISRRDWDSFETSWDFKKHPLI